ncbi:MAG: tRNA (adenosine(37)-N6)-dimethylallyltransferase MiaA [bacterium]|nr:tRNA (adenosine(37)-N6)-dimethylallyltransferase MiaA [bacterium]
MNKKLLLTVVGPTASGKSEFAIALAQEFNGEIISADSRQIYKGFDISSGKVEGQWVLLPRNPGQAERDPRSIYPKKNFLYKSIPHYLIDEASPRLQYSVARFQKKAIKIIKDIHRRGKTPILCGGTGHWIDAVTYSQILPKVKPDRLFRAKLHSQSAEELFKQLQKLDPLRAKAIDRHNPRRLVRALEIIHSTGKPVPAVANESPYNTIWIGINPAQEVLHANIHKRLNARLKQGMIEEVQRLHTSGLSWQKLESFGLEYKYCALYLQGKITKPELIEQLETAIRQYAKRQLTWWKRNKDIHWKDNKSDALKYARKIIEKNAN